MRIYKNLYETVSETERNLWEMGIEVPIKTMQNKNVEGDLKLGMTKELWGITFQILNPLSKVYEAYKFIHKDELIINDHVHWVQKEFQERISDELINPGEAWKIRYETWNPFLVENNGTWGFDYTYNERYNAQGQLKTIIEHLKKDKNSRRAVLNMYIGPDFLGSAFIHDGDHKGLKKIKRVPCSVDYSWLFRNGKLNIFYHMRSSDFYEHFLNDMMLTAKLNEYVAEQIDEKAGIMTVYINSLHAYYKDLEKRKIF